MKKVRFLALAVVAALLLIFPAIVMGQPLQDHQSRLMVMVDGEKAPDDTKVTAMIDGEDAGSAMTMDGIAFLKVPGTSSTVGMEISFMVGDLMAAETDTWERGGHQDKNLELNASTGPPTRADPHPQTSTPASGAPRARRVTGRSRASRSQGRNRSQGLSRRQGRRRSSRSSRPCRVLLAPRAPPEQPEPQALTAQRAQQAQTALPARRAPRATAAQPE